MMNMYTKLITLLCFLSLNISTIAGQNFDCPMVGNFQEFESRTFDWYDNDLDDDLTLNVDLTFLHRNDGSGNFQSGDFEINLIEGESNKIWKKLGNQCSDFAYNERSGIQIDVNNINHIDNSIAWDRWNAPGNNYCPGGSDEWQELLDVVNSTTETNSINIIFLEQGTLLDILEPAIGTDHGFLPGDFEDLCKSPFSGCSIRPDDNLKSNKLLYIYILDYYTEYIKRVHFKDVFYPNETKSGEELFNDLKYTLKNLINHELGHTVMNTLHPCNFPCDSHLMINANECERPRRDDKAFIDEPGLESLHCTGMTTQLHRYYNCEDEDYDVQYETRIADNGDATTIFDTEIVIHGDLIVKSGTELIIENTVYLSRYSNIIVERGGRLVLSEGGKLTNYERCHSQWKGITLEGNGVDQPSFPYGDLTSADAGVVVIESGAIIENARTGITCHRQGESWNSEYYGGLIIADDATFLNCNRGVAFMPMNNDNSIFSNVTFDCENSGITAWNNHGVTFSGCTFTGMSDSGIYSDDGTFNIYDNCLFEDNRWGVAVDYSYPPVLNSNKIGKESGPGNIFRSNGADLVLRGAANNNTIYENQFWNSSDGIYMDGLNRYRIEGNQFMNTERRATVMFSTGSAISDIQDNEYTGTRQGILLYGDNDQTDFDYNCFYQTEEADIFLGSADINDEIGTQGASAANCFSNNGAFNIYTSGVIAPFTYWEPGLVNCQVPTDLGGQFRDNTGSAIEHNCSGSSGFSGGESDFCSYDLSLTNMDSMIYVLEQEIVAGETDTTLTFQEEVRLKKAKICIQQALTDYVDSLLVSGNCDKAFALYDRQTDESLRIKAYSVLMECGDCTRAQDWLSSFNTSDEELSDYITVQSINVRRLCDPREFIPTEEDLYTLYPLTQEDYPYAAYARSLWHILTGESIFLPLPEITRDVNQRSVDDGEDTWSLYPNPTSDLLTITFDVLIESGQIMITDQLGRCVKEYVIEKQSDYQLNVANYDSGIHYIRVSADDKLVYIDKFIVQR